MWSLSSPLFLVSHGTLMAITSLATLPLRLESIEVSILFLEPSESFLIEICEIVFIDCLEDATDLLLHVVSKVLKLVPYEVDISGLSLKRLGSHLAIEAEANLT